MMLSAPFDQINPLAIGRYAKGDSMFAARYGLMLVISLALSPWAQGNEEALVWSESATRIFSNRALGLTWDHRLGDWIDSGGEVQGREPFSAESVRDKDRQQFIYWDMTEVVRSWLEKPELNQGVLLKNVPGSKGVTVFVSREGSAILMPLLIIELDTGEEVSLEAAADTFISAGTLQSQGAFKILRVSSSENALLYFRIPEKLQLSAIAKARLFLATTNKQYGNNKIGVYQVRGRASQPVTEGIAAAYTKDQGLLNHPGVFYSDGFDAGEKLSNSWDSIRDPYSAEAIDAMPDVGFESFDNKALRVKFTPRDNTGISMALKLKKLLGHEPEAIYFRYYVRLGNDWNSDRGGGKFPGFGGTYDRAGWGGRKVDGYNGWSARGMFLSTVKYGPHRGKTPIGSYVYHADSGNAYGQHKYWSSFDSLLEKNRWYSVEQYLRLNTPKQNDGELKAWIDGRLVADFQGLRWRNTDELKIEKIWFDFYHGGGDKPSSVQHLLIDNVVVANEYIGPARRDD